MAIISGDASVNADNALSVQPREPRVVLIPYHHMRVALQDNDGERYPESCQRSPDMFFTDDHPVRLENLRLEATHPSFIIPGDLGSVLSIEIVAQAGADATGPRSKLMWRLTLQ